MKVCNIRQISLVGKSRNIRTFMFKQHCHCIYCDVAIAYSTYCDVDAETIYCAVVDTLML